MTRSIYTHKLQLGGPGGKSPLRYFSVTALRCSVATYRLNLKFSSKCLHRVIPCLCYGFLFSQLACLPSDGKLCMEKNFLENPWMWPSPTLSLMLPLAVSTLPQRHTVLTNCQVPCYMVLLTDTHNSRMSGRRKMVSLSELHE